MIRTLASFGDHKPVGRQYKFLFFKYWFRKISDYNLQNFNSIPST